MREHQITHVLASGYHMQQEMRENVYAPRLVTYTQPTQLFDTGAQLAAHTQLALRIGHMAPIGACPMYPKE